MSGITEPKQNGTNGHETKTPFLIGVAGGTASGKVNKFFSSIFNMALYGVNDLM